MRFRLRYTFYMFTHFGASWQIASNYNEHDHGEGPGGYIKWVTPQKEFATYVNQRIDSIIS